MLSLEGRRLLHRYLRSELDTASIAFHCLKTGKADSVFGLSLVGCV